MGNHAPKDNKLPTSINTPADVYLIESLYLQVLIEMGGFK